MTGAKDTPPCKGLLSCGHLQGSKHASAFETVQLVDPLGNLRNLARRVSSGVKSGGAGPTDQRDGSALTGETSSGRG
jgi:hypothetical protein